MTLKRFKNTNRQNMSTKWRVLGVKKIIIFFILLVAMIWNTFASNYTLTRTDRLIINNINSKISILLKKHDLIFKNRLEAKINEILEENKSNKRIYSILEQVRKDNFKLNYNLDTEYMKHYEKFNIDFEKVKDRWLKWHNDVRSKLWNMPYNYDERLNNTSYLWSKKQREDWFLSYKKYWDNEIYSYNSVNKWFTDRWVNCKVEWWAGTRESVWKFWYKCTDQNCSDEFLNSLKVIFDIFMSKKWNNANYLAITQPNLKKIWLWIAIYETKEDNYYEYYITSHYCSEFVD